MGSTGQKGRRREGVGRLQFVCVRTAAVWLSHRNATLQKQLLHDEQANYLINYHFPFPTSLILLRFLLKTHTLTLWKTITSILPSHFSLPKPREFSSFLAIAVVCCSSLKWALSWTNQLGKTILPTTVHTQGRKCCRKEVEITAWWLVSSVHPPHAVTIPLSSELQAP